MARQGEVESGARSTLAERSRVALRAVVVAGAALGLVAVVLGFWLTREGEVVVAGRALRLQRAPSMPLAPHPSPPIFHPAPPGEASGTARNLVLLLGDGMGIGTVSTVSALLHGPSGGLLLESAPVTGLVRTAAANNLATDSAASGTSLATGFAADRRSLRVLPDGRVARSILEAAGESGRATGMVTNSFLVDATPAAFTVVARSRRQYRVIFERMLTSGVDLLIGGDSELGGLDDAWGRAQLDRARSLGFHVARTAPELEAAPGLPLLALFPERDWPADAHGPSLAVTTTRALDLLGRDPEGFVLVAECEITDTAGHDQDAGALVEGVAELDAALRVVLERVDLATTLVVVTADHDTGGTAIVRGRPDEGLAWVRFASDDHTAQWVPLFAFGAGAEALSGVHDNTEVGALLGRLLGLEGFPHAERPATPPE